MRNIAGVIGVSWMAIVIGYGIWLGVTQAFMDTPGIFFQSGFGDIWILAIAAIPGYALWKWAASPQPWK